jgi:hypothetical protein
MVHTEKNSLYTTNKSSFDTKMALEQVRHLKCHITSGIFEWIFGISTKKWISKGVKQRKYENLRILGNLNYTHTLLLNENVQNWTNLIFKYATICSLKNRLILFLLNTNLDTELYRCMILLGISKVFEVCKSCLDHLPATLFGSIGRRPGPMNSAPKWGSPPWSNFDV